MMVCESLAVARGRARGHPRAGPQPPRAAVREEGRPGHPGAGGGREAGGRGPAPAAGGPPGAHAQSRRTLRAHRPDRGPAPRRRGGRPPDGARGRCGGHARRARPAQGVRGEQLRPALAEMEKAVGEDLATPIVARAEQLRPRRGPPALKPIAAAGRSPGAAPHRPRPLKEARRSSIPGISDIRRRRRCASSRPYLVACSRSSPALARRRGRSIRPRCTGHHRGHDHQGQGRGRRALRARNQSPRAPTSRTRRRCSSSCRARSRRARQKTSSPRGLGGEEGAPAGTADPALRGAVHRRAGRATGTGSRGREADLLRLHARSSAPASRRPHRAAHQELRRVDGGVAGARAEHRAAESSSSAAALRLRREPGAGGAAGAGRTRSSASTSPRAQLGRAGGGESSPAPATPASGWSSVPRERLAALADGGVHQGVVAELREFEYAELEDLLEAAAERRAAAAGRGARRHPGPAQPRRHHPLGPRAGRPRGGHRQGPRGAGDRRGGQGLGGRGRALPGGPGGQHLPRAGGAQGGGAVGGGGGPRGEAAALDGRLDGPLALVVGAEGGACAKGCSSTATSGCASPWPGRWGRSTPRSPPALLLYEVARQRAVGRSLGSYRLDLPGEAVS